jgi:5-methylcytosine-specific restriction endonuclease McrA
MIATDVHHIVDLADGGDPWSRANLEALCAPCHGRTTARRGRARASKAGEGRATLQTAERPPGGRLRKKG